MKIKELPDFRHDWNIMFQEGNLDLLEYVVDVANKFHPYFDGQDISQSEDPIIFNDRYIESTLDLRGRYDRMRSMGWLKDCSWEDFEMNNSNAGILDTSFREKFMDKQLQNTIAAYGLDVSKFWYLILYVNDYVKDTCVGAYKVGTPLIEDLNEMNEKLSEASEITFTEGGKKKFSTDRKEVIDVLRLAMQHFINDYNNIVENPDEKIRERLKAIGLDNVIHNASTLHLHESVTIDLSYRQYKFAEMMLYFLKDKKGKNPPHTTEMVFKEKHFFVSMLLYVVGLYAEDDEEIARKKWYEPYYNDKDNRNLSNLVRNYKNRKFPNSAPKIYWK